MAEDTGLTQFTELMRSNLGRMSTLRRVMDSCVNAITAYSQDAWEIIQTLAGTMEIPDSAILHEDYLHQLYALEFNNKMYMLQMCLVAESPSGEYEMIHQYDEMEQHEIKNVRYDAAEFEEIIED